ncbi:O-antigen ligase [Rhizobium sp. EC-SD404]|uniref:O-antigen ligase family protein n=1 Tax=Rhizobium sp. EC-SD404 TaxID=2038389 RepID=UPI00125B942F|nr:O-antigen ligase [Rhizobium sp. EC-SD404]VVT10003.1 Exopolysaccharide production protein ExoQ [Rhizobium sp. EC-SD404]
MRIAKAHFLDPRSNGPYGVGALALSIVVFAYSTIFGPIAVLAFYGVWMLLVAVDYRRALGNPWNYVWIFVFCIFCGLSVFWSLAPSVSARGAVQYASHILCAIIAARVCADRTLTIGVLVGVLIVLLYSFAFGGYHYDAIDGTYSFVGAFASKNQLGFYASLGVFFAGICIFALPFGLVAKGFAAATGLLSAYALVASQSATSIIGVALTVGVLVLLRAILALRPSTRRAGFIAALLLGVGFAVVAVNAGAIDTVLGLFGKDATLTGRTYLWSEGLAAFRGAPLLGTGYQAYWVQGFAEAERLWAEFYIGSRNGFHFHNTYIEALVELGAIGLVLLVATLLTIVVGHLLRVLNRDHDRSSYILLGLMVLMVIRSFAEVDSLYPYSVGSFLVYFAGGRLALKETARSAKTAAPRVDVGPAGASLEAARMR